MREVCEDLESWLWLKLAPYKFDINLSYSAFIKLQRIVSFEYGKLIIELKFLNNLGEMQYFFFSFCIEKKNCPHFDRHTQREYLICFVFWSMV